MEQGGVVDRCRSSGYKDDSPWTLPHEGDATLPTTTLLKGWLEVLDEKTSFRGLKYPRCVTRVPGQRGWL